MSEISGEETVDKQFEDKTSAEQKKEASDDDSDLPPLEDIKYDDKSDESLQKKKIVIPEDETKPKKLDDGWLDVLDNGELKKFVLTAGQVGQPRPERGCIVAFKMTTKLLDTQERVESECFDLIDIILGESDVIQGLDLLIPLMDQKEISRCLISPRFAYGEKGKGNEIPPNATLDCEVHLQYVQWLDEETVLPIDDRIRLGNRKKEKGNFWFGRQEYSTSISCYKSALKLLDATEEELASNDNELKKHFDEKMKGKTSESNDSVPNNNEQKLEEMIELRSATYNNLAMAQMKIEDYNGALKSVDAVLITQPNNVKALFRKGKIWAEKGELELAIESLRKALSLDPDNKAVTQELSKYGAKRKKELVTERNLYKRMLELDTNNTKSKGIDSNSSKNWRKWSLVGGAVTASVAVATALAYKFIQ